MVSEDAIVRNPLRARFAAGQPAFGLGLQQSRSPAIVTLARRCGFDWLFIDLEHGPLTTAMASDIAVAGLHAGLPSIVRVAGKGSPDIARLLDGGALGIVVPHVDSPEEAQAVALACRYPPLGRRSFFGMQPQLGFQRLPVVEAMAAADPQLLAVVMLESPQAIESADAIAATPGVDVLLMGCNDLSMELAIPGQIDHPRMAAARAAVVSACRRHGKVAGIAGIGEAALLRRCIGEGMQFVMACNDTDLLLDAGIARIESLRR